jgi:hypothetical protein
MPTDGGHRAATAGRGCRTAIPWLAAVLCSALLPANPCRAEIRGGESIEWLVADSDLVARCRLVEIDGRTDKPQPWWRLTFEVTETIKGPPADRLTVSRFANAD